jgi:hypothetical protein
MGAVGLPKFWQLSRNSELIPYITRVAGHSLDRCHDFFILKKHNTSRNYHIGQQVAAWGTHESAEAAIHLADVLLPITVTVALQQLCDAGISHLQHGHNMVRWTMRGRDGTSLPVSTWSCLNCGQQKPLEHDVPGNSCWDLLKHDSLNSHLMDVTAGTATAWACR